MASVWRRARFVFFPSVSVGLLSATVKDNQMQSFNFSFMPACWKEAGVNKLVISVVIVR